MKESIIAIYRCRRCGAVFSKNGVDLAQVKHGTVFMPTDIGGHVTWHRCKPQQAGVAELIGVNASTLTTEYESEGGDDE